MQDCVCQMPVQFETWPTRGSAWLTLVAMQVMRFYYEDGATDEWCQRFHACVEEKCKRKCKIIRSSTKVLRGVRVGPCKEMVFNPALNCPRLMDDERRCNGSSFQTVEAATWKLCRPSCVLVEGTIMSWRSAQWRFARPETPATGTQTLLK